MFKLDKTLQIENENWDFEFWPKQAKESLEQKEYGKVIELCEKHIGADTNLLSARLIYAAALRESARLDDATEQLYQILRFDTDHLAALKLLGDIHYQKNDSVSAMANYNRVLEIDPDCSGLKCDFSPVVVESLPQITLVKAPETVVITEIPQSRNPFMTETVADLYLKQGQPRRAIEIFKELLNGSNDERLTEKLAAAEKSAGQKGPRDVEYSN
ncbi:MAG: hypothetical protein ACREBV_04040 [Candidatus Zixiibacteriota bacterium]